MASYLDGEREVICVCGSHNDELSMRRVVHRTLGTMGIPGEEIVMVLDRCQTCCSQSLCRGNARGIHGEVLTADEDDYLPERLQIDGIQVEPPNTDRFGYCVLCEQGCYFDVALQRWRDLTWVDVAGEWASPPVPPSVAHSNHGA